ncbi:hypothetical protein RBWH47_04398 [Rhodopirellula baltica WH47]|uniref:Uncharacterized protein n=1 Tax=Rhodopirellula baltica WH47 TaxID=991778 RepID=F2AR85_RHOBT|nr:hypothetical protein RBWH47_04398 [Rhodopirellula baltica WH47]
MAYFEFISPPIWRPGSLPKPSKVVGTDGLGKPSYDRTTPKVCGWVCFVEDRSH